MQHYMMYFLFILTVFYYIVIYYLFIYALCVQSEIPAIY